MSTTIEVSEQQIAQVAEAKIAETCARHGVQRDSLKQEVITDAYHYAKDKLTAEAEQAADPNYQLRKSLQEENRLLKMQVAAMRSAGKSQTGDATSASSIADPDTVRVNVGDLQWNHKLDANGRLQACGIDPSLNTSKFRQEIKDTFGPGSSLRAAELARTNHARYKLLKAAGKCLRII
jgi:hypothetical protein